MRAQSQTKSPKGVPGHGAQSSQGCVWEQKDLSIPKCLVEVEKEDWRCG